MSQQGAVLQSYNNELVKCIEDLCTKRDELQKQILSEEEEKAKVQNDIRVLTEKLAKVNESLAKKISSKNEYDKTIAETESAYMKKDSGRRRNENERISSSHSSKRRITRIPTILESSQTLLHVLKKEVSKDKVPIPSSVQSQKEKPSTSNGS